MAKIKKKLHLADPTDPDRCDADIPEGECPNLSVKGMVRDGLTEEYIEEEVRDCSVCPAHGADRLIRAANTRRSRAFQAGVWAQRIEELGDGEETLGLRNEVGILRLLAETLLKRAKTSDELLMYAPRLESLCANLERLVRSCDRIENSSGNVLHRSALLKFAADVLDVIAKHVEDENVLNAVGDGILDLAKNLQGDDDE